MPVPSMSALKDQSISLQEQIIALQDEQIKLLKTPILDPIKAAERILEDYRPEWIGAFVAALVTSLTRDQA